MMVRNCSILCKKLFKGRIPYVNYSVSSEDIEKIKKFKENQAKKASESGASKMGRLLKDEVSRFSKGQFTLPPDKIPKYSEYVVIGGGIVGSAIAYSMKQRAPDSFDLTVIERDPKVFFVTTVYLLFKICTLVLFCMFFLILYL